MISTSLSKLMLMTSEIAKFTTRRWIPWRATVLSIPRTPAFTTAQKDQHRRRFPLSLPQEERTPARYITALQQSAVVAVKREVYDRK